jgi:Cytochrome P450.
MSKTPGDELLQQTNLTKWSKHRKIIGTSFRFFVLKLYTQIFFEEATILAKKMKDLATSKQAFEAENLVGLATLNALLRSSFGVDFEIQQNYLSEHPYLEAVDTSFQVCTLLVLCNHIADKSKMAQ